MKEWFKTNWWILLIFAVAAVYDLNLTAGFLEIIPDNLPLVGNLDEGVISAIAGAVLTRLRF